GALQGLAGALREPLQALGGLVRGRRRATLTAELLPGSELRATGAARRRERRTAVLAELRASTVFRLAPRALHIEPPAGRDTSDRRAGARLAPILQGIKKCWVPDGAKCRDTSRPRWPWPESPPSIT